MTVRFFKRSLPGPSKYQGSTFPWTSSLYGTGFGIGKLFQTTAKPLNQTESQKKFSTK